MADNYWNPDTIRIVGERAAKATPPDNSDECALCEGSEEVQYIRRDTDGNQFDYTACPCSQQALREHRDMLSSVAADVPGLIPVALFGAKVRVLLGVWKQTAWVPSMKGTMRDVINDLERRLAEAEAEDPTHD